MKLVSISLLTAGLLISNPISAAEPASKKQCTVIYNKIEKLNDRRRSGGSAKQMNKWKKQRDELSEKAYLGKCRRFGILK